MVNKYTIYLVNEMTEPQNFWCFLERPEALATDPGVYANSSAHLTVRPRATGLNRFVIPAQFVVGAGASNQAVDLNVQVLSDVAEDANLGEAWDATYFTVPPQQGPMLDKSNAKVSANAIAIVTSAFNRSINEQAKWFSNQSFGIQTATGFIGMTWSPAPNKTRTLEPKLTFYIAEGSFGVSTIAEWTDVSNGSAKIDAPNDFDMSNECTVTYSSTGEWSVAQGPPTQSLLYASAELQSHEHYLDLLTMAYLSESVAEGNSQLDTIVSVDWTSASALLIGDQGILRGKLTVGAALTAAFAIFVLSGIRFSVDSAEVGSRTVHFSYSGDRPAHYIKGLFKVGASLLFKTLR